MHIKPMKPFISNMFRMHKTLDVVTLFHKPSVQASTRIATLLKQASAQSQEHATEDQASDHSHQHSQRDPFQLDITEAPPTPDQLKSIFEYVGGSKAAQLVKGASSQSDALKKLKESPDNFLRPVVSLNLGKLGVEVTSR
jgi:arsenate reductase-like glutaredoxin family protein